MKIIPLFLKFNKKTYLLFKTTNPDQKLVKVHPSKTSLDKNNISILLWYKNSKFSVFENVDSIDDETEILIL